MARKTIRKISLAMPKVAHKRFSYEERTGAASRAAKITFRAFNETPEFVEDEDGHLLRVWKEEEGNKYTHGDCAQALRGRHVVEREDLLEYIPERAIGYCETKRWIVKDPVGDFYRVTTKAQQELELPTHIRGRKIHFFNPGR